MTRHPTRAVAVHLVRVAMVGALLAFIPTQRPKLASESTAAPDVDLTGFADLQAARIGAESNANGMWPLLDPEGTVVGMVARTLPAAMDAIGYRGPTEAAIVFDKELRIRSVQLIHSADTPEHVEAVKKSERFFAQFRGWTWGGPPTSAKVDGVSGATLTSLALAKGIVMRIGGDRPSLVFPDPIALSELSSWPGGEVVLDKSLDQAFVYDEQGRPTGRVLRTGPLSDDISGYQGPTELLVWVSPEDRIIDLRIRRSYDNEPYVGYVRTERSFWKLFKGKTIGELSQFDPTAAGVEGVSGATMTSVTIADTLVAAAGAIVAKPSAVDEAQSDRWHDGVRWSRGDWATVAVLIIAFASVRFRLFRNRTWRRLWLLGVLLTIGLWTGNLVSLALVAGWSAEGIAWQLAPGLFALIATAFVIPPLTKGNPYCNHLCPHGAVQQWIKPSPRSRRHWTLPHRLSQWLTWIPGVTLVAAYLALITRPATDLSAWEPFHAYLFRIASWGSIALALGSLVIAAMIPMAYCRLGCPTGRLLGHLRRSAHSERIALSDYVAAGLLAISAWLRWA